MHTMYIYLNVLLYVLACVYSDDSLDTKIVGGTVVTNRANFAYQVSLQMNQKHICGGVIYNKKHILTAAHCVYDINNLKNLQVVSGMLTLNDSKYKQVLLVKSVKVHEKYNSKTVQNDIALIKLSSEININANSSGINVWNKKLPAALTICTASGWGSTNSQRGLSNNLLYADVKYVNTATCKSIYGQNWLPGMICAASTGKDSCQGDSGGPLVINKTLLGLVSWGYGCANSLYPGVYTDVSYYEAWIKKNDATLPVVTLIALMLNFLVVFV